MILNLSIKNYALIDSLDIAFNDELNIITGETGSGKSILLGALGLIIGERAYISAVKGGAQKCVVEGIFDLSKSNLKTRFKELDLDFERTTIIRREILANGKSRAFVNDTPVKIAVLKEIGFSLVDIHSQHQTIQINNPAFQMEVLDTYVNESKMLAGYREKFIGFTKINAELEKAETELSESIKELDYISFQVEELRIANLEKWKGQPIDAEYNKLSNAEEIRNALGSVYEELEGQEQSAVSAVKAGKDGMESLGAFSEEYQELSQRLNSVLIELKDISGEVESLSEGLEQDPHRLEELDAIRGIIFNLERKHGVSGIEALIALQNELESKLNSTSELEMTIAQLRIDRDKCLQDLLKKGKALSKIRKSKSVQFCREIESVLKSLNIEYAKFECEFSDLSVPGPNGIDGLSLRFSANLGQNPAPLNKVASGGELSRVVLAIKKISAQNTGRLAMVFDEIDTGVSGEVANAMGLIISEMSANSQIICITHLPQIASKGKSHFKVFKEEVDGRLHTDIRKLNNENRIVEIAQLLSGAKTSDAALANARELLHLN